MYSSKSLNLSSSSSSTEAMKSESRETHCVTRPRLSGARIFLWCLKNSLPSSPCGKNYFYRLKYIRKSKYGELVRDSAASFDGLLRLLLPSAPDELLEPK